MENVLINALAEAFNVAVQKQVTQQLAALTERVAALEYMSTDRHERLRVLEGALTDRVAALENQTVLPETRIADDARVQTIIDKAVTAALEELDIEHEVSEALNNMDLIDYIDTDDIASTVADQFDIYDKIREVINGLDVTITLR